MRRITPHTTEALFSAAATRALEQRAAQRLAPHALMARAGEAVARLARALHPHARRIWVACGPGNNGGDGLIAALHLHRAAVAGRPEVIVTHHAQADRLPPDAQWALGEARAAGLRIAGQAPEAPDLVIDALLGIGARVQADGPLADLIAAVRATPAPVLCVDLPSGLDADTGAWQDTPGPVGARHTLSLLTLKPGLFTGHGRDAAGEVWLDDLGVTPDPTDSPDAWLGGLAKPWQRKADHPHAGHKGSYGDVAVLGGESIRRAGAGMTGAAVLAARAALHAGAGRVYLALLDEPDGPLDPGCPELMLRSPERLTDLSLLRAAVLVCGCGGGSAIGTWLPTALGRASRLVLDADALNAIAADPALHPLLRQRRARGWTTVITPHPLEAARLMEGTTADVMADRLSAARLLAQRWGVICVLKGSGTVVAAPDAVPWINATGNALLATAGTGDVLAGMIGAALARGGDTALHATCRAVAHHGALADGWPADQALVAARLAGAITPW